MRFLNYPQLCALRYYIMDYNLQARTVPDGSIYLDEEMEAAYRTKEPGVSKDKLQKAVQQADTAAMAVKQLPGIH
ncbi:MAG: hypothetical protein JWP34_2083 [Massilia sp.]|nr:hypothetical protein [Massilia sp.]